MRIRIIGGPGSGKSTLARQLAEEYGIPHYDLDNLQWDNAAADYGTKRDPSERDALLADILKQDDWIIEGVYYAWCRKASRMRTSSICLASRGPRTGAVSFADSFAESSGWSRGRRRR